MLALFPVPGYFASLMQKVQKKKMQTVSYSVALKRLK